MGEFLRLASIDIGTNSTRLLVADCDGNRTFTLDRRMAITRLGAGVDRTGMLSAGAVSRTMKVLRGYGLAIADYEPEGVRVVATSAVRDCRNGESFLEMARDATGRRPEILSGESEARMSFLGAVSDLRPGAEGAGGPVLVFDIGGGSTELIVGYAGAVRPYAENGPGGLSPLLVESVDVGCVRMSERFLGADPPSGVEIARMESHIEMEMRHVIERIMPPDMERAIGLAGTVTTLSGIRQGLAEYDIEKIHHSLLTRDDVEVLFERLASVTLEERKRVMGLEPERADVILGGAAVLRVIMDLAGLDEILVSEKDILDGLIIDYYHTAN